MIYIYIFFNRFYIIEIEIFIILFLYSYEWSDIYKKKNTKICITRVRTLHT